MQQYTLATLLARCECLKRHGVGEREGELGADFNSIVLPRLDLQSTAIFQSLATTPIHVRYRRH